ncbi:hypothetical protein IAT38_007611 [Cryptococcus sp. DSM 104549]
MVRFKNRYLLVEFLTPSSLSPSVLASCSAPFVPSGIADDDDAEDQDEEEDELVQTPKLPFVVPVSTPKLNLEDGATSVVFKAIKEVVLQVFGDEGWGRVGSNFKVLYYSSSTTLTIIRVARSNYRLLWSALTFLTTLGNPPVSVIPRVLAVSGTIRKVTNHAIVYHRAVVGQMVGAGVAGTEGQGLGWGKKVEREREEMKRLQE